MESVHETIKGVLTSFLGEDENDNESYEDSFYGLVADEDDIELLTSAIAEALENKK